MMSRSVKWLLLLPLLYSCSGEEEVTETAAPLIDFGWTVVGDCSSAFVEILFENKSEGTDEFVWDFGDGTTSTEINPVKIYSKAGTYIVTLSAGPGLEGEKEIIVFRNSNGTGPEASLSFAQKPDNEREVEFTINTNQLSYRLDFGDGNFIVANNNLIRYRYPGGGTYFVTLTVENEEGKNCSSLLLQL